MTKHTELETIATDDLSTATGGNLANIAAGGTVGIGAPKLPLPRRPPLGGGDGERRERPPCTVCGMG
jgi:hypothetical protein